MMGVRWRGDLPEREGKEKGEDEGFSEKQGA